MSSKTIAITSTAREILDGLKSPQKHISSKFFYDTLGSRIFQDIMEMPEYYLTSSEAEIFEAHKEEIATRFCASCCTVDLVELGAGDGMKTRILISELLQQEVNFRYIPVDISEEAVIQLAGAMKQEFPGLSLNPRIGDYFHMLGDLSRVYPNRKVVMFLGSNLGNFNWDQSIRFLSQLNEAMSDDDHLFIGLDLKKDPEVIKRAYNDPNGHTREFNLNLLRRINRELGANFNTEDFRHAPSYNPETGVAKSTLVSKKKQEVHFTSMDECIHFDEGDAIFTEMSQKYDLEMIHSLALSAGFEVSHNFFDSKAYFVSSLWKKV